MEGTAEHALTPRLTPIDVRLTYWILGAMFVAMTSIGGFTASRLITQNDTLQQSLSDMKVQIAIIVANNSQNEKRLESLERYLYGLRGIQAKTQEQ